MKRPKRQHGKKTIFRAIFIPLFLIMVLQAVIFYLSAVYGGVESSLRSNATDIISERLENRKIEIESHLNNKCFDLDACVLSLSEVYASYEELYGNKPLTDDKEMQISFLDDCSDILVDTLRKGDTNGVFIIINDKAEPSDFNDGGEKMYGICIRDIDQESDYTEREDLLIERSPSSIVESLGCSLDSWWEAWYTFETEAEGDYYYKPLNAAWDNPRSDSADLAYLAEAHNLSESDQTVLSYSVPLISKDGYPYAVVGVELTVNYLQSLLPGRDTGVNGCYVYAFIEDGSDIYVPSVASGSLFSRCFGTGSVMSSENRDKVGGFTVIGRDKTELYGIGSAFDLYNDNNPFESKRFELLILEETRVLFGYISRVKMALLIASFVCLILGIAGILLISRCFASPITELSERVRNMDPKKDTELGRLGITEIDSLVDAIEELNKTANRTSARTEFFSRMSHDMRTPMNAILSFSSPEMLSGTNEMTKDTYLETIHSSSGYLLGLINEVLDMTKIESNRIELNMTCSQATSIGNTAIPIIEELARERSVDFTDKITADADTYILLDRQRVDQIVLNLLSNAVKFTPKGGSVKLEVSVTDDPNRKEMTNCVIIVSDTGIGISEDFMKKIYTPFEQENTNHEGTGLGLSITKKLTEMMGGTIDCKSAKGEGTTFTVCLSFEKGCVPNTHAEPAAGLYINDGTFAGKNVLVCEDNMINAKIVCRLLEKMGITVDVAKDGQVGVDKFSASELNHYDAVLMDIQMPVMDGLAATKAIRALGRKDAATVPIIAMTANAFEEDIEACKAAGMNQHLAKPIETDIFHSVLIKYLGKSA